MSEKLTRGCIVFLKASSGLMGYGNGQCVSGVCEQLGTISLFGHNQHYSISDIDRIAEYSLAAQLDTANTHIEHLENLLAEKEQEREDYLVGTLEGKVKEENEGLRGRLRESSRIVEKYKDACFEWAKESHHKGNRQNKEFWERRTKSMTVLIADIKQALEGGG